MMGIEPDLVITDQIELNWNEGPFFQEGAYGEEESYVSRFVSLRKLLKKDIEARRSENLERTNEMHIQQAIDAMKLEIEYLEMEKSAEMSSKIIQGHSGAMNIKHIKNKDGMVTGGECRGTGISILWQFGTRDRLPSGELEKANGAFVEDVLIAAKERLKVFQKSPLKCKENKKALKHIEKSLKSLEKRRERRKERGVEGTYRV